MIDDDYDGVSGQSSNASLISPVIDLSNVGTPYLKVEFDQYFQEFQLDTTFVGVSTDGGATWEEIMINEIAWVAMDDQTLNWWMWTSLRWSPRTRPT